MRRSVRGRHGLAAKKGSGRPGKGKAAGPKGAGQAPTARAYDHASKDMPLRPDVGLQNAFKQKKAPAKYRFDASLDPQRSWDENPAREEAEALIRELTETSAALAALATEPARGGSSALKKRASSRSARARPPRSSASSRNRS